ncbi:hypothetical protein BDZ97DRAFT_261071 [Flammula alnicola]|nr:hypothetical protein BDZ97DRAFT_261071 [Flammula alnicola]
MPLILDLVNRSVSHAWGGCRTNSRKQDIVAANKSTSGCQYTPSSLVHSPCVALLCRRCKSPFAPEP